ncbi:NAD(P)H-dependent oxidoreductase [Clostridium sp. LP20]|uniref:NAD(P)H-dependent oxidoreductase n=1 Tax=Clostridium sp. LP20 TaxID=3418665 RepID=UPI003EE77CD1
MKICIFNGMNNSNDIEGILLNLLNKYDISHIKLREKTVGYCRCCNGCAESGICVQKDDGVEVLAEYKDSELIIFLTNIKYGTYSKTLKKAVDRLLPIGSKFLGLKEGYMVHKMPYNGKKLIAIGAIDNQDCEEVEGFKSVVKANYINFDCSSYKTIILNTSDNKDVILGIISKELKEGILNG